MKKVVRTIAAVALLFATTTVMANELKLATDGTSKSLVLEWDAQLSDTSIKIEDKNGNVMYTDNIVEGDKYLKKFDLAHLPQGDYFLKVENSMKEVVYSISVNKNDVSLIEEKENLKPFYKKKEGMVYLSLLNLDKEEVKVTVLDSANRVLFKEAFENKDVIEKVFNFKNALEDRYTVVIKDGKHTFYEAIVVK